MISGVIDNKIEYPAPDEFFSPTERFPEYPFDHIASSPNTVYCAVRKLLAQSGLDIEHYGTPQWNPLGKWISPGQTVFALCNFVYHRRPGESHEQFQSKCTHGSVIRAVIDYIIIAVGPTGRVRFGNAPLQSCMWPRVMNETGGQKVEEFYRSVNVSVESADLRLFIDDGTQSVLTTNVERREESEGITIDLGGRSLLASLDGPDTSYRVSDYDPDRTDAFHQNNSHKYVLHRHILESDVIVSIPKLKTHEKVGVTCGIKGCVGAIGHKDCLAHHRKGAPKNGGDEFRADPLYLLACFTRFHDYVQRTQSETVNGRNMRLLLRSFRFLLRRIAPTINGSWSGNDTCWRMAVDIARLIGHATRDGAIVPEFIRPHLVFLDGVIGGEGNGPLDSRPVKSSALLFADNPVDLDNGAVRLMGYDPNEFPIVRETARLTDLPVRDTSDRDPGDLAGSKQPAFAATITVNGKKMPLEDLGSFSVRPYRMPRGWRGALVKN